METIRLTAGLPCRRQCVKGARVGDLEIGPDEVVVGSRCAISSRMTRALLEPIIADGTTVFRTCVRGRLLGRVHEDTARLTHLDLTAVLG